MSLYVIGFIVWTTKKLRKVEQRLKSIEGSEKTGIAS
jgi:hypothetical protein